MGVFVGVVIIGQSLEASCSRAFRVQFVEGLRDEFGDFLGDGVLDILEQILVADESVSVVDILDIPDFLGGEEYANFVGKEIEVMRSEGAGALGVELVDGVLDEGEVFDSLGEHLAFDFVEYLVGLVLPVHRSYRFNKY